MQQQVTRDFEAGIPEEEDTGDKPKLLARDRQLLIHRKSGKPDVDPIEKGDDVKEKEERQKSKSHFADRLFRRDRGGNAVRPKHLTFGPRHRLGVSFLTSTGGLCKAAFLPEVKIPK